MELARHHDADLTFGRYAHTRLENLSKVVDKLPDLWEKCGKGDGLSVDPKSKAGMGGCNLSRTAYARLSHTRPVGKKERRFIPTPFPHLVSHRDSM